MNRLNNKSIVRVALVVAALVVAWGGYSLAQEDAEGKPAPSSLVAEIASLEKDVASLSNEQKLDRAVGKIEGMKGVLTETSGRLEKVREQDPDLLKINCLNEKMAAIKGFLKVSEQGYGNLKEAAAKKDNEAANHHYTLIAIAGQKVGSLGEEARTCAGEATFYQGDPITAYTENPNNVPVNPVDLRTDRYDDGYVSERLPPLTPFQ